MSSLSYTIELVEVVRLNKEFNMLVGMRIRQTRELMGLTRERFSELCGVSDSFLADVERGKKGLSVETLYKICTSANVSPNYIVLGNDNSSDTAAITDMLSKLDKKYVDSASGILSEFIKAIKIK